LKLNVKPVVKKNQTLHERLEIMAQEEYVQARRELSKQFKCKPQLSIQALNTFLFSNHISKGLRTKMMAKRRKEAASATVFFFC